MGAWSLEALLDAGRRRWPGVGLAPDVLARALAAAGVSDEDLAAHGTDLFLATACAEGDTAALAAFDEAFLGERVAIHLARFRLTSSRLDELRQDLRVHLLAGPRPRIGRYAGRAPLDAWVRVTAVRLALDALRAEDRGAEPPLAALVASQPTLTQALTQAEVRPLVQRALDESLARLSRRELTLLRMHFVDGLSLEAIGLVYRVHRATIARWLLEARRQILADLRARLALELRPSSSEFRDLVALVMADLQISLGRLLERAPGP